MLYKTIISAEDLKNNIDNKDFIIINKPSGLVMHPGSGCYDGTLANALLFKYPELKHLPRSGIVHRLDKDTSGLMIFAKNRLAASNISKLFQNNQIHKYYIAITNKAFKKPSGILSNENNEKKILKSQYRRIRLANYEFVYLVKLPLI